MNPSLKFYTNPLFGEVMSTPNVSTPSDEDSTGSFDDVIRSVLQRTSTPESLDSDSSGRTARAVYQSYAYVTKTIGLLDSSQDDSYSTPSSEDSSKPWSKSIDTYPSDYLESTNTIWSSDVQSPQESKQFETGTESGQSADHLSFRRRLPLGKATCDAEAPRPTSREISGWLLCNVGIPGFKALLWILFPLLIFSLFAASSTFTSISTLHCPYDVENRDPRCLKVCDSFTKDLTLWTSGNQSRSSGATILEILSNESQQPAALITGMLGASVILQLVLFTITSPLLDYGNYQRALLALGTGVVVVAATLPLFLFRPAWWWIGGIFFLLSTIGIGLASTWLDHYLSSLSKGIPVLKTHMFNEVQIYRSVRIQFVNTLSFTGIILGCFSSALCTLAAFFFLRSRLVAETLGIGSTNWALRFACCIGGLWLFFWNVISCTFLIRGRPGPSLQAISYPARKHLPMAILGMGFGSFAVRKGRSALLLLLVCFLSSLGNATVFQSGLLCFSPRNFITLALAAQVFSLLGTVLFFVMQNAFSRSSKFMMLIALLVHLLIPIYACLGFFNTSKRKSKLLGLNQEWEFIFFAGAYGLCLGTHRSCIRTLFLASIPATNLVGVYFCLFQVVNQLSTFVGTLEMLLFVYHNGDLRYTFVTMGVALLLANILMVKFITDHLPGDGEVTDTDTESLYPASLVSESVHMSSGSGQSDGSVPVYIPKSLRKKYSTKSLQQNTKTVDSSSRDVD